MARIHDVVAGSVQTTDATVTTLATFTVPDESAWVAVIYVAAEQAGSANVVSQWAHVGVKRQSAGSAALIGTLTFRQLGDETAGVTIAVDVNGNDFRIRVTGIAATTIDWSGWIELWGQDDS